MIQIISDNGKVIEVESVNDLTPSDLGEIFHADPRPNVTVTYVVTSQPQSRRMTTRPE